MKKLLMLGTCKGSIEMLKTARKKGLYTIVTDFDPPEKSKAKLIADEYWMISTKDLDALEQKSREEKIDGIVTGVSEGNLETNMELCKRLGLPCYCTPESWHYSRNKHDFKELCKNIGVRMAEDYHVSNPPTRDELDAIKYPVVVKAINLSSNRGMSYCNNEQELIKACEYARSLSNNDTIIVERMLKGPEVSAVYVMADGEARLLSFCSMNSQPGESKNCYSISTTESKYLYRFLEEENPDIIKALKAVGCKEGFGWVEMIVDEDDHFYLLEMGYRLCGDEINVPLRSVANFDVHEWIIDYALGCPRSTDDLPPEQTDYYKTCANVYCLWTKKKGTIQEINGIDAIISSYDNISWDSLCNVGDTVPENIILGEFLFESKDVDEMVSIIDDINKKVKITNQDHENMVIYYTDFDHLIRTSRKYAEKSKSSSKL